MAEIRACRKCLLQDLAEEDQKDLKKYLGVIKAEDKVSNEEYERRLNICRMCDKLIEATCQSCGCYVEYRAIVKHGKCPNRKW